MKKTLTVLLSLLMLVTLALTFVACDPCANGHDWDSGTIITQSNCDTMGVTRYTCSRCGEIDDRQDVAMIDHSWDDGVETSSANCTTQGEMTYTCTVCHTTKTEPIEAEHTLGTLIAAQEATCVSDGVRAHYECSVCHKLFDEDKNEVAATDLVISANNNHSLDLVVEASATCLQDGMKSHYECSICHKLFDEDKNEVTATDLVISANGNHAYKQVGEIAATCLDEGIRAHFECDICDKTFVEVDGKKVEINYFELIISKTEHTYGNVIVGKSATCDEPGIKDHYECSVCHTLFVEQYGVKWETSEDELVVAALGHNFNTDTISNGDGTHYQLCANNPSHRRDSDCELTWIKDLLEGKQHHQQCFYCGYATDWVDHTPVDGKCACGALVTDFDTTDFTRLGYYVNTEGAITADKYFALGTVKSIDSEGYNSQITIVDEYGKGLIIYGVFNEDGTIRNQAPSQTLAIGDVVVFYGVMANHQGTVEMQYAWLVQHKGDKKINLAGLLLVNVSLAPNVVDEFTLPTAEGKIKWTVVSGTGITIENNVAKVSRTSTDQTVVLKATATVDGDVATKEFTVVVQLVVEGQDTVILTYETLNFDNLSYANNNAKSPSTVNGFQFVHYQMYKSGGDYIQAQKTNSYLYNLDAFGRILKIEIVFNTSQTSGTVSLMLGKIALENKSSATKTETVSMSGTYTWTVATGETFTFLRLDAPSVVMYIDSIKITYEVGGQVGPTPDPDPTHTHVWGTPVEAKAATCTEAGNVAYVQCTECEKYFTNKEATTELQASALTIPALNHDLSWESNDGQHRQLCSRAGDCGYSDEWQSHTATDWQSDADNHWYECTVCHNIYNKAEHNFRDGACIDCGKVENTQQPLEPVVFEASAQNYVDKSPVTTGTAGEGAIQATITFDQGVGTTAPTYYDNGTSVRAYGGNTITVAAPTGLSIAKIIFTFASGGGSNEITANVGTWASTEWTGNASVVVFTVAGTSGHRRVQTIIITYTSGSGGGQVDPTPGPTPDPGPIPDPDGKQYYVKVTSIDQLVSGGKYLIVYENGNVAFDGSLSKLDATNNTVAVSIVDNKIEATAALNNCNFTITASGDGYTIKSSSGFYIGRDTDSNGIDTNESSPAVNTITFVDGQLAIIGAGGSYLRFNATKDQDRFRYYKSTSYTNQQAIQLYVLVQE